MPDRREDLPITGTETDEDLTPSFTYEELLNELAEELAEPVIPEGAITVRMLMEKTGRIEKTCRSLLDKKVKEGKMGVIKHKITNWYYLI